MISFLFSLGNLSLRYFLFISDTFSTVTLVRLLNYRLKISSIYRLSVYSFDFIGPCRLISDTDPSLPEWRLVSCLHVLRFPNLSLDLIDTVPSFLVCLNHLFRSFSDIFTSTLFLNKNLWTVQVSRVLLENYQDQFLKG